MTAIAPASPPTLILSPAAPPPVAILPDDLLKMDGLFELVDGQLLEKQLGVDATLTVTEIILALGMHVRQAKAGYLMPEQTFQCFPDKPNQVRRPDIAFVAAGRMPIPWPHGHLPVRPDLVIEVVSSRDEVIDLEMRLDDYRSAGVPVVWVVVPDVRLVRIHTLGGPITERRPGDMLTADPVLPAFAVAVADLFPAAQDS